MAHTESKIDDVSPLLVANQGPDLGTILTVAGGFLAGLVLLATTLSSNTKESKPVKPSAGSRGTRDEADDLVATLNVKTLYAYAQVKIEAVEDFIAATRTIRDASHGEPGCLKYNIYQNEG